MNISVVEANNFTGISASASACEPSKEKHAAAVEPLDQGNAAGTEAVNRMVEDMQCQIDRMNVSLKFTTYGKKGEKIAVVVTDKETGEVVREIPAREIQKLYAKMSELAGLIFNRQI